MTAPQLDTSVRYHLTPLLPWLDDPSITEIAINRPGEVWIEKASQWQKFEVPELTFLALNAMATAVAAFSDNHVDTLNPVLSATLPRGERIQFVIPPAVEQLTVSVTIRKPGGVSRTLQDYVNDRYFDHIHPINGDLNEIDKTLLTLKDTNVAEFLKLAVLNEKTIAIAGGTGSGKTAFMNALMEEIPTSQRIITIEDVSELKLLNHLNKVHLFYPSEAKMGDPVTSAVLLKSCLRMKPDRIMLAELRGGETFDFINVAASGHGGSITSLHADSATMAFERLALMVLQNPQGANLPYAVIMKLLHQVIDIVIHIHNDVHSLKCLGRHMTEIYFDPKGKL